MAIFNSYLKITRGYIYCMCISYPQLSVENQSNQLIAPAASGDQKPGDWRVVTGAVTTGLGSSAKSSMSL